MREQRKACWLLCGRRGGDAGSGPLPHAPQLPWALGSNGPTVVAGTSNTVPVVAPVCVWFPGVASAGFWCQGGAGRGHSPDGDGYLPLDGDHWRPRVGGAKAWLHVQDFEVDAAFDLGLLKGQRIRKLVAGAERWLMRRFDVVSTISQRMHQRLLAKGVAAYRRELFIPDGAVVALYSGNMGGKQGLEVLADLAKQNNWGQIPINFVPNTAQGTVEPAQAATNVVAVVFVFCGNGAGRADLVQRCQGLPNVRFIDLQPAERLPDLLATADIHLLPQRADAADLVMPSKLTGMLTSARIEQDLRSSGLDWITALRSVQIRSLVD